MPWILVSLVVLLWISYAPLPALAQPSGDRPTPSAVMQGRFSPESALARLFTASSLESAWFSDNFLQQVPLSQVQQILASLQQDLGAYQAIQTEGRNYRVIFERGTVLAWLALNTDGRIAGLFFQTPQAKAVELSEAIGRFQELSGEVSFSVTDGTREIAALNSDRPLAVGSAFKLAVLAELRSRIAQGEADWDTVLPLAPEAKSLPSGFLQTWPDGSRLTLETLATLMISQSDNTATDQLILWLGRDSLAARSPRNTPFLTTREAFVLKDPANANLLRRYLQGTPDQRRALLANDVARLPLPDVASLVQQPRALEVEWFFSARDLCDLMGQVADLPLMGVNPGLANPKDWARVAFKGGSEPGVINLTTWLEAADGRRYCVAATWNNPEQSEEARFSTLYSGVLEGLKTLERFPEEK